MRIQIGVMGSADGAFTDNDKQKAYKLGEEIARHDCAIVTGGCPGLPYEATKGAKSKGGVTIGISPGRNLDEHINKYKSPTKHIDVLIYTGAGLMGREVTAINSSDIVIIVSGRSGTLGEFSIAYDDGKLIGVLAGTGGITNIIEDLVKTIKKPTGSTIVYNPKPDQLIKSLLDKYNKQ